MRKIIAVFIVTMFVTACAYVYSDSGDLSEGHHGTADQYGWYVVYDDGKIVHEYYLDTQPVFNTASSDLDLVNVREGKGIQLLDIFYDQLSFPVDEYSILHVAKLPIRSDSADVDEFEWRVTFVDAAGHYTEFYTHHQPEELWPPHSNVRVLKMVRGFVRVGNSSNVWSFSEYYIAGPARFFLLEQRPPQGWD